MSRDVDDISDLINKTPSGTSNKGSLADHLNSLVKSYDEQYQHATAQIFQDLGLPALQAKQAARKLSFTNALLVKLYFKAQRKKMLPHLHANVVLEFVKRLESNL